MSLAGIRCRTQLGLEAPLVHVEVNVGAGLPMFMLVGLPATVVKESKERVRASILNSGFEFPAGRITVNLAPADVPKRGGWFDLPIAIGILLASDQLRPPGRDIGGQGVELYGELALSGELKPTAGLLIAATHAARAGHEIVLPLANAEEACRVRGLLVRGARHLLEVCAHLEGRRTLPPAIPPASPAIGALAGGFAEAPDLADIRGQAHAKRALTVAAAGGHSLLFIGAPGAGKSSLARRLPGLLPALNEAESLEVAAIASASVSGFDARSFGRRPFRSPHHTASAIAIVGGGRYASPGEISLAHHGVLFLDELPEFDRTVLESLREPLETGEVCVSRAARRVQYPAAFQLIAAMNPCPCGYLGDPMGTCHCPPEVVTRYRRRISGPLLDRLDLQIEMPRVKARELLAAGGGVESAGTAAMAASVLHAREAQIQRQGICNARLAGQEVLRHCAPDQAGGALIDAAAEKFGLSARACHRALKVARTIADLAGERDVLAAHVGEALLMRATDRRNDG